MAEENKADQKAAANRQATSSGHTITDGADRVAATDAETERVRKAWYAGEQIPEGFSVRFGMQGGETVMIVEKAK